MVRAFVLYFFHLAMFTPGDIDNMMQEAIKMKSFSHLNVLGLIGVSIDAGEAPYIVMPYMANGSLLAYLRKERVNLTIAMGASEEVVSCCHKSFHLLRGHFKRH